VLSLVRNGKFLSASGTASRKNSSTAGRTHSLTKPVFVAAFSVGRLIGSFHKIYDLVIQSLFEPANIEEYF
jgi:hypothetical protein